MVACLLAVFPGRVLASQATPPVAHRFLLVVETSRAMQPRVDGLLKTVQELLGSGLHGQLQPGDSLGLWTFNQELYAGRFPLQSWSSDSPNALPERVLGFLKQQKYEKMPAVEKVMPQLDRLIHGSELLTIVLVSTGQAHSPDTPFAAEINEVYQRWGVEQQKARMPFVTVLRARASQVTDYVVSPVPWPLEFPPLPKPQPPQVTEQSPASPPPKPAVVPPLILSGRKTDPAAPPKPGTNSVASAEARPPLETAKTESAPVEKLSTEPKPAVQAAPAPVPETKLGSAVTSAPLEPKEATISQPISPPTVQAAQPEPRPLEPPKPIAAQVAQTPASAPVVVRARGAESVGTLPAGPPVEAAVVVAPTRLFNSKGWLLSGMILAGLAGGALLVLMLRSRSSAHVSLITRSIESQGQYTDARK